VGEAAERGAWAPTLDVIARGNFPLPRLRRYFPRKRGKRDQVAISTPFLLPSWGRGTAKRWRGKWQRAMAP